MSDENNQGNVILIIDKNVTGKDGLGNKVGISARRSSRGSAGGSTDKVDFMSAPDSNKKRIQEQSPAKSAGKRKDIRESPASKVSAAPKNRRETVDATDLADLLDDLDNSVTSVGSMLDTSVASTKSSKSTTSTGSKKGGKAKKAASAVGDVAVPSRRSSRLSDTSVGGISVSDISTVSVISDMPLQTDNRRNTIDPSDIDALLNDSTTSSQMRHMTTASPASMASKARAKGGAKARQKEKKKKVPSARSSDASDISALSSNDAEQEQEQVQEQDDEVCFNLSESATAAAFPDADAEAEAGVEAEMNDSYDDRRTTMDAADFQALLDEEDITMDTSTTSSRRSSIGVMNVSNRLSSSSTGCLPLTGRTSVNVRRLTADAVSMMEAMLEEKSDDEKEKETEEESVQNVHSASASASASASKSTSTSTSTSASASAAKKSLKKSPFQSPGKAKPQMPKAVQNIVEALLSQEEEISASTTATTVHSYSSPSRSVEKVISNSFRGRRASMATSTVRVISHQPFAPRRTTADLADLRELAMELAKQKEQEGEQEQAQVADMVVAITSSEPVSKITSPIPSPVAAPVGVLEQQQEQQQEQEQDDSELQDSVISLGALISRRGTIETSFNSSFADSRRESRQSFEPAGMAGTTTNFHVEVNECGSPIGGRTSLAPVQAQSALKSCLSSKKMIGSSRLSVGSARKNVIFGSPKAVEFTKDAPTGSMTPLARNEAKSLFSMVGSVSRLQEEAADAEAEEDDDTRDNSAVLEEWDRLTNTSNENGSDEETDEFPLPPTPILPGTPIDEESPVRQQSKRSSGSHRSPRRRSSGRLPAPLNLTPALSEASHDTTEDSFQKAEREAEEECAVEAEVEASFNEMDLSSSQNEVTGTVNLPADFAELMAQIDVEESYMPRTTVTAAIDNDISNANTSVSRGAAFIAQHRQSLDTSAFSIASDDSKTMALELDLQGVLRHVDYTEAGVDLVDTSTSSNNTAHTASSNGSTHSLGGVLGLPVTTNAAALASALTSKVSTASADMSPCLSNALDADVSFTGNYDQNNFALGRFSFAPSPFQAEDTTKNVLVQASSLLNSASPAELSTYLTTTENKSPMHTSIANVQTKATATPSFSTGKSAGGASSVYFVPTSADNKRAPTAAASAMLNRLRGLNDETRRHTLSQSSAIGTPGASRLSFGAKRHALATSATKAVQASETKRLNTNAAALQASGAAISSWQDAFDPEVSVLGGGQGSSNDEEADIDTSADTVEEEVDIQVMVAPPPEKQQEALRALDLKDVFTAAQLDVSNPTANNTYGLFASLQQAQLLCSSQVFDRVTQAMHENVCAAVKQAVVLPADMNKLQEIWAGASIDAHTHVRELSNIPMYRSSPGSSTSQSHRNDASTADTLLISLSKQCKQIVTKKWSNWEGELINMGAIAVENMRKEMSDCSAQWRREAQELRSAIHTNMTTQSQSSSSEDAQRIQLNHVQKCIHEARENLEKCKAESEEISEEISNMLEQRKQALVMLAHDTAHQVANEDYNAQRIEMHQQEITEEWNGLADTQKHIRVLDRISYYRTVQYGTGGIGVEVALTAKVCAKVNFSFNHGNVGLEVNNVDVDVVKLSENSTATNKDSNETTFALAFFKNYIGNNITQGPLAVSTLAQVDSPKDIPHLLQRISGQVLALRRALASLSVFSTDGYSWTIINGDDEIIVTFPDNKYQLRFRMNQVIMGGVMQITPHALRSIATGEPVAEYPMKAVVNSLRMRFGPGERGYFQSFPSRAIRKEVEAIVKLI